MFVLALSYCNCTALLGAAPNLILRRTQLVQRKPFWSWLSWNLTVSNLDNLPAQATERKLTRLLLLFNPSPCTDLVACVTGVRKARERGFGALINMAKGARGKRSGPPSLPSSLLAHPPQFKSYSSLSTRPSHATIQGPLKASEKHAAKMRIIIKFPEKFR